MENKGGRRRNVCFVRVTGIAPRVGFVAQSGCRAAGGGLTEGVEMTSLFTIHKQDEGGGAVRITVTGEIDNDVSAALSLFLVNAAEQGGVRALLIDLERVPLLAAAGIRSLLTGREAALRRECSYCLVNVRAEVADALHATGVSAMLLAPAAVAV